MMRKSFIALTAVLALSLALVAVLLIFGDRMPGGERGAPAPAASAATAPPASPSHFLAEGIKNFVAAKTPADLPMGQFQNADGGAMDLSAFKGKVVLVNLWATWCAPCRAEMPALDKLQATLGGTDFAVVAISQDSSGIEKVKGFLATVGASHLTPYIDPTMATAHALGVVGLPTSFLVGRDGKEIGRLVGPAEWDSPAAQALIKAALDKKPVG